MPKTSKKTASSQAELSWLPQRTFELKFSIPWSQVKKTYDQALNQLAKTAKMPGFRKGKVPKKLLEDSVDKGKLYGEVINQLLPLYYAKAINQHQLKPAVNPKIQIIKAEPNQAWQFKAVSCELPEVKLGDYQKIVRAALAKEKIWTPDKGDPKKAEPELSETQKLSLISKALIDNINIDLPELLVNQERDRLLAKLLDQIQKLGLTIEQYAASNGKTVDQLRKENQKIAENTLKIELILQAIAADRKVEVKDKEIDQMINQTGDEKLKKQLNTPSERAYIASVLRKRQVIDYLLGL